MLYAMILPGIVILLMARDEWKMEQLLISLNIALEPDYEPKLSEPSMVVVNLCEERARLRALFQEAQPA